MSSVALDALLRLAESAAQSGSEPAWLARRRAEGLAELRAQGLPGAHWEAWRFTPLDALASLELSAPPEEPRIDAGRIATAVSQMGEAHCVVLVDGLWDGERSSPGALPPGVKLCSLAEQLERGPGALRGRLGALVDPKKHVLSGLNDALFRDGVYLQLDAGAQLDRPLHVVHVAGSSDGPVVVPTRLLLIAGAGSRATIVEHHLGADVSAGLCIPVSELDVDAEAQVEHVVLQEQPPGLTQLAAVYARQQEGSRLRSHSVALGSSIARLDVDSRLEGERAGVELYGAYLGRDRQLLDHYTTVDHAAPATTSLELYKGVLAGRAKGVFHGRIHVRPDCTRIDAKQTNRGLLLSDRATLNTKPQLEIYADDVKCSHGASIGQLDGDALFYLRARGLDLAEARALLTFAFAREVLERLPVAALRKSLEARVLDWLPTDAGRRPLDGPEKEAGQ